MTLPTTSTAETKKALHEAMAADLLQDYRDLVEATRTDGGVDDKRKLTELHIRVLGLETDRKQDPNAGLPVFNFVFHAPTGEMKATITMPVDEIKNEALSAPVDPTVLDVPVKAIEAAPATLEAPSTDDLLMFADLMLGDPKEA